MENRQFIAFDLGATSGRTILGTINEEGVLSTEELTRFPNHMLELNGHLYWDIYSLYANLVAGLEEARKRGVKAESIGIDTWGVDVAYVAPDGKIFGVPNAYRDIDTIGAKERFFEKVMPASELYKQTGIQHLDFNTVFQLNEHRDDFFQKNAGTILFMPDALIYMLTGKKITEYTIASTGEILDPSTHQLLPGVLEKAGVRMDQFAPVVEPGTKVGELSEELSRMVGCERTPVVAVAEHDTGSAVAAIPARDKYFAYLSSGTWSLMGIESEHPVINEITEKENITNEGGVYGTVRVLKNITGMWVVEECLRKWKSEGTTYSYPEMVALAEEAPAFKAMIDPDDPSFVAPRDMPEAIAEYCRKTGQPVPETHGEYIRVIFESLALKYRKILDIFKGLSDHAIEKLHVIGGGSRNALLNTFTASAIGLPVIAGPAEASAIGNIMMQAGCASLQELRDIVGRSVVTVTYHPENVTAWDEAYKRYLEVTK